MSNTRNRVLDAAADCFDRIGSARTSMTDIARAAGVSRQTVYVLFADRRGLTAALGARAAAAETGRLRADMAAGDTPAAQLRALLGAIAARAAATPAAGAARVEAATRLLDPAAPALAARGLSPAQLAAFVVAAAGATGGAHDTVIAAAVSALTGEPFD